MALELDFNVGDIDTISITIESQIQPEHVLTRFIGRCNWRYFLLLLMLLIVGVGAYFIYGSPIQSGIIKSSTSEKPTTTTGTPTTTDDIWNPT